jgi:3-oxoacyl-[acyl-carrier protein] reductase
VPPIVLERVLEMTPLGRLAQPEDVANAVLYLAGDTAVHITGATLNIDGGA